MFPVHLKKSGKEVLRKALKEALKVFQAFKEALKDKQKRILKSSLMTAHCYLTVLNWKMKTYHLMINGLKLILLTTIIPVHLQGVHPMIILKGIMSKEVVQVHLKWINLMIILKNIQIHHKEVFRFCLYPHLNLIQRIKGVVILLVHLKQVYHLIPVLRIHLIPS
jgi:hypothetical protein